MSNLDFEWDLVVLTADKDMQFVLEGLLKRPKDLGIRPVKIKTYAHPQHDPDCRLRSEFGKLGFQ